MPNPSLLNYIYYYQSDSLVPLEKKEGSMKTKRGLGGGEGGYSLDGEKSPFRIMGKEPERFVLMIGMAIDRL